MKTYHWKRLSAVAAASLVITGAIADTKQPSTVYRDVTATHVPVDSDLHALGSTMADIDNDGDLDVIVAVEHGVNRLYLNDGTGKLTYKAGALGETPHDNEHVVAADFNQDGWLDLVFVAEDDRQPSLFFGEEGANFTDQTQRLPAKSEGNALAVADVNGDGLPDIVVGNTAEMRNGKVVANPQNFLWLNDKDNPGNFIDATETRLPQLANQTQHLSLVDINNDGSLDMVVANQSPPNQLLLNDGQGYFRDAPSLIPADIPLETRQAHVADFTGDGSPDILLFNLTSNNHDWDKDPQTRLYINDGNGKFTDATEGRIPYNSYSVYSGIPIDLNQDGHMDFLAGAIQIPGFVPLRVRAYINNGKGTFSDETHRFIPEQTVGLSWGMSKGDLNGDGKDDVFIGGWGTQARLILSQK